MKGTERLLTASIYMLESRQLPILDFVNDTLHTRVGENICLDKSDAVWGPDVSDELVSRALVANDGQDLAVGPQRAVDG